MAKLTPVDKIESFAVIIRAIHERGDVQAEALAELDRRGLWLTTEQRQQAGLSDHPLWEKPKHAGAGDTVRQQLLSWGTPITELGDVRIMDYGADCKRRYRVACFCPGHTVCVEGDTPKTEPECDNWCDTVASANSWFELYVDREHRDGWKDYRRNG